METAPKYQVTCLVTPPTAYADLTTALAAFQSSANDLLTAAGYPNLPAQVSASILPSGLNFQVSAQNPACPLYTNLSFGMATAPEAALAEFRARLVPMLSLNALPNELQQAA
jgi:hypothetical protein